VKTLWLIAFLSCSQGSWGAQTPADGPAAVMQVSLQKQHDSLNKQFDSLRQQLGKNADLPDTNISFLAPLPPLAIVNCPPLAADDIANLIGAAAKKNSLQPEILHAVMKQESGFKPCAVSVKGAQGLMQLMPATAGQFHVADPFDPEQNVEAGAAFLKQLLGKYNGDLRLALIAYNAGSSRADQGTSQAIPQETQNYLAHIFGDLGIQRVEASAAQPVDVIKPPQDPKPILANPSRSQ